MDKFVILLCLVGLVASGLIDGRLRQDTQVIRKGERQDIQHLKTMTKDELLRQKFILEILQQVELPLQNRQLLEINMDGITEQNLFEGPIDDDMRLMLDLIRSGNVLSRNSHCSMTKEQDLRQMLGLYRLLVRSRDFETFQRLTVYARKNINPMLFVNAITLAMQDRRDTRNLIVPALHEILPRLYHQDDLIKQVGNLKLRDITGDEMAINKRRNILDIIGLGKQSKLMNLQSSGMSIMDRSHLWKPWQEMHKRLALQHVIDGHVVMRHESKQDVIVLTSSERIGDGQMSLIANDVGLKSFLNVLVDELVLTQGLIHNSINGNQLTQESEIQDSGRQNTMREGIINNRDVSAERRWLGKDIDLNLSNKMNENVRGSAIELDRLNADLVADKQRDRQSLNDYLPTTSINSGRLLHVNRRFLNKMQGIRQPDYLDDISTSRDGSLMRGTQMNSDVMRMTNIDDDQERGITGHSNWDDVIMNRRNQMNSNVMERKNIDDQESHIGMGMRGLDDMNRVRTQNRDIQIGSDVMERIKNDDQERVAGWGMRGHVDSAEENVDLDDTVMNQDRDQIDIDMERSDIDDQERLVGLGMRGRMSALNRDSSLQKNVGRDSNIMTRNNIEDERRVLNWGMGGHINNAEEKDDMDDMIMNRGRDQIRHFQMNWNAMGRNDIDEQDRHMVIGRRDRMSGEQTNDLDDIVDWGMKGYSNSNENLDDVMMNEGRSRTSGSLRQDTWQDLNHDTNIRRKKSIDNQERFMGMGMESQSIMDRTHLQNDDDRISMGRLLLQQLQQVVARLNIEDISLHKSDDLQGMPGKVEQQISNRIDHPILTNVGIDERQREVVLNKITEISDRLEKTLQMATSHISNIMHIDIRGSQASQQMDHILLTEILNEVLSLCDYVRDGQVSSILENSTTRLLLRHIINTVDNLMQRLQRDRNAKDIVLDTVKINDVKIDKLQTYVEYSDVDMSNMLEFNKAVDNDKNMLTVIGRIPRLNHKPFAIDMDITSDRNQQVIVRVLLVPKIEALGSSLENQRKNVVLLDIAKVDLKVGRNQINCQSRDVSWTGRDSTLYTDIYQRVMGALKGNIDSMQDTVIVRNDLLPHRLLVPRGRVEGLPMQLIVVVTPAEQIIRNNLQLTGRLGMDSLMLDDLPLTYPLDKNINDLNTLESLPNIHMKSVLIYHKDKI